MQNRFRLIKILICASISSNMLLAVQRTSSTQVVDIIKDKLKDIVKLKERKKQRLQEGTWGCGGIVRISMWG